MIKLCDDCFEEFEAKNKKVTICDTCNPPRFTKGEQTGDIWKRHQVRGFKSQQELDDYQFIKKEHKRLTGRDLPTLNEKVK